MSSAGAPRRFLNRLVEVVERKPLRVTMDKHAAYPRAIRWIVGQKVLHRTDRYPTRWSEARARARRRQVGRPTRVSQDLGGAAALPTAAPAPTSDLPGTSTGPRARLAEAPSRRVDAVGRQNITRPTRYS